MQIPKKINLFGITYAVKYQNYLMLDNKLCYGMIDYEKSEIVISSSVQMSEDYTILTLLHELMHGIVEHFSLKFDNEEDVVEKFAKGVFNIIKTNKNIFAENKD